MIDKRYVMLIEALDGTVKDLRRLLKPVDAPQALFRATPGHWCIKDVLAHLADIEPQFRARLMRIVATDNPLEPLFNPNPDSHDLSATVAQLIEAFERERTTTTQYLGTLTQAQWLRVCTHETFGVTRLRKQVEILVGHDNEHLAQLVEIREAISSSRNVA